MMSQGYVLHSLWSDDLSLTLAALSALNFAVPVDSGEKLTLP